MDPRGARHPGRGHPPGPPPVPSSSGRLVPQRHRGAHSARADLPSAPRLPQGRNPRRSLRTRRDLHHGAPGRPARVRPARAYPHGTSGLGAQAADPASARLARGRCQGADRTVARDPGRGRYRGRRAHRGADDLWSGACRAGRSRDPGHAGGRGGARRTGGRARHRTRGSQGDLRSTHARRARRPGSDPGVQRSSAPTGHATRRGRGRQSAGASAGARRSLPDTRCDRSQGAGRASRVLCDGAAGDRVGAAGPGRPARRGRRAAHRARHGSLGPDRRHAPRGRLRAVAGQGGHRRLAERP